MIELEESLTLDELDMLIKVKRDKEYEDRKFFAALKGIDLDENKNSTFEEVKMKADAALAGKSSEEYVFEDLIGIDIEEE